MSTVTDTTKNGTVPIKIDPKSKAINLHTSPPQGTDRKSRPKVDDAVNEKNTLIDTPIDQRSRTQ